MYLGVFLDIQPLERRQNLKILVLFLIVQFLGLLLATQVYNNQPSFLIQSYQVQGPPAQIALSYIVAVIVFSAVILILLRRGISRLFFYIIEGIAIFGGSFVTILVVIGSLTGLVTQDLFAVFYGFFYSNLALYEVVAAIVLAALFLFAKHKIPRLRNAASVIASVGIALLLGIELDFGAIILFLLIFAIYDYIAVFVTKHMVAMGNAAVSMNLALMIGVSDVEGLPAGSLNKQESEQATKYKKLFEHHKPILRALNKEKMVPYFGMRALGNGDLAIPLMAVVGAYKISNSFLPSMVVALGAAFGLLLTFYVLEKYRRPLPAIPPLAFGILLALAIYFLAISL